MADLNRGEYLSLKQRLYDEAVTMLRNVDGTLPLKAGQKVALVTIGKSANAKRMADALTQAGVTVKSFNVNKDRAADAMAWLPELEPYDLVVVNVMQTTMNAAKDFSINYETVSFCNKLVAQNDVVMNLFGCPYALDRFRINNSVIGLLVAYQDDECAVNAVNAILTGNKAAHGVLPVSTSKFHCGEGVLPEGFPTPMPATAPVLKLGSLSVDQTPLPQGTIDPKYERRFDSIARMGIDKGAYPGCQVLVMHNGQAVYDK